MFFPDPGSRIWIFSTPDTGINKHLITDPDLQIDKVFLTQKIVLSSQKYDLKNHWIPDPDPQHS
jgi:hypothetical protein